ncbi:MAG: SDR family oxidoreductase [Ruegeria sp.]|nr:SDR family oxidoreductase [Ruegeria sp.]
MLLENKTIIVTGASSGIGEAAALLFAAQGANVVLGARRENHLADLSKRIQENQGSSVFLAVDVADETYASALVELAEAEFGGLDAAFDNAGVMGNMGPLTNMNSAKAALFLISEQSSFVTGSARVADGGNSVTKG